MKKNITSKARQPLYFCNLIVLLCCVSLSFSQTITKQYEQEISTVLNSKILVKGPGDIPFQSEGRLKVNTVNGYALEPRDNEGVAAFIANGLDIKTSTTNVLKQLVTVKIIPHSKYTEDAQALAGALKIEIIKNGNTYEVDNNLNITALSFKNGFFTGTKNIIKLKDGSSFNVRGIEISSEIFVPRDVTLSVTSKYIDVAVGDFNGTLNLNADKSNVKLSDVSILKGYFKSCNVSFKDIDTATIIAYNSKINGDKVNRLDLVTEQVVLNESLFGSSKKASLSNYTIHTVESLNVIETSSDEFNIRELGTLQVASSHFSNYNIETLNKSLSLKAKNGNVTIGAISKDVTKLDMDNQVSTIKLGVQQLENYELRFPNLLFTEKSIPDAAKDISKEGVMAFAKGDIKNKGLISISCNNCKIDIKD